MREEYNFNISLSVLNHLGRNLYRNVITIIGEAISNSWDADAKNVRIEINKSANTMAILDDGLGMSDDDFQEKFLKIGYSKRKNGVYKTPSGRPFIGRKGIGKLALLSCAKKIHIATKCKNGDLVGGIIDNNDLDEAIKDDVNSQDYILKPLDGTIISEIEKIENGTLILFEEISDGIVNTVDYIKKSIALYFKFSLIDPNFNIYVNGEEINETLLSDFAQNTQFLWKINQFSDNFTLLMNEVQNTKNINSDMDIKGYIASVNKPSSIKIRGTQERVTIDLFVNGRLREKDILRHIPTSRIVENYVYGQIHFDILDNGVTKDVFTSSREGIVSNEPMYKALLKEIKRIFAVIIEDWDKFRIEQGNDGDPDNNRISKRERKGQELFVATLEDMQNEEQFISKGGLVEKWVKELSNDAQFNIPSYAQCFISENLLRKYIVYKGEPLSNEAIKEAKKWRGREFRNKENANISYDIRQSTEDLYYLDMTYLSNFIDKSPDQKNSGLNRSAVIYKPLRDAVGHTSLLTDNAKAQLTIEYNNIQARLLTILKALKDENRS
jgi:hypothetical protein